MRILIATKHRNIAGGVESYLAALLGPIGHRGHQLAILHETPGTSGQKTIDDKIPGLPVWCSGVTDFSETLRQISAWQPDVAYVQGLDSSKLEGALLYQLPAVL